MLSRRRNLVIVLLVAATGAAASGLWLTGMSDPPSERPVTVQLSWRHEATYAGFHAADQMGAYTAAGLKVGFLVGGAKIDPLVPVVNGEAQFGIANASRLLIARGQGKAVQAIACIHRRSPLVFITMAESGISHPTQFAGKTVRLSRQNIPVLYAVTGRFGIGSDDISVTHVYDLEKLYAGEVDIWGGYITHRIRAEQQAGRRFNIIHPDNFGVHFYYNCIFTSDDRIAQEPDLVRRFLRITLSEGFTYAIMNPDAASAMIVHYDPDADVTRNRANWIAMLPLINTGEDEIGWMKPEDWAGMAATLKDQGLLDRSVEPSQAYTLRFLEEIYGPGA
jgi:ABC-type nitrate/sulfonate/bicarbonate transport system substrate-binding protein